MKLYYHPVSTTSRPIMMLAAESNLDIDWNVVDLFTGAHLQPAYASINPSCQVPVLEDGDFRLTESSAILKYLADKYDSPAYPAEPKRRARVNELMDWFNTGLYRDLGYGFIYPQTLPHYKRPDATVHAGTIAWGREKARGWLKVLDENVIGPRNAYLTGSDATIADHLGAAMLTLGEVVHIDYSGWRNISRWLASMKARPHHAKVHEPFYAHFVAPYKDAKFEAL